MPGTLVRGASIVDGTGAPARRADVLIEGGRITAIGGRVSAASTLDADGLVLAPGFIDMHSHSETRLRDPDFAAKALQGVTCEVIGQDGLSYAPADPGSSKPIRDTISGWHGGDHSTYPSVASYLASFDRGSTANVCYLVPHGNLRAMTVGFANRPATEPELARMRALLVAGLTDGAFGLSTGLTYTPGMYADTAELVALCRTVAEYGGYHGTHHRSYGAGALDAYAEVVDISRESGCALHLAHATMNFPPNRGRAAALLSLVDDAVAGGVDVTLDTYPYLAGSTTLAALLPSWVSEGGPAAIIERLLDPDLGPRIRHAMEVEGSDGCHGVPVDWSTVEISGVGDPALSHATGRTIAELAEVTEPFAVFADLLVRDGLGTTIRQHVGDEDNVRAIMRHPMHTAGSDGLYAGGKPHPRAFGTFPRYLGHYSRELGLLSLEECVRHLTGTAARRLGLGDRGLVREGCAADLVLFDPETVADTATYDDPMRAPEGIPHVFVNGEPVVRDGRHTGRLPGRALRRGRAG